MRNTHHLTHSFAVLALLAPLFTLPAPGPATAAPATASAVLAELVTADEVRAGYQRSLFPHWLDTDGDGCDTRREVLVAEAVTAPADCRSNAGVWSSVYDGKRFTDARKLDVDHVVALAEAWDSGARKWTTTRRAAFANDLTSPWSLVAVSAASNRSKSDKDISAWNASTTDGRCFLVVATVITKWRWSLSVDRRERAGLAKQITACGNPAVELPAKYTDGEAGPATPAVPSAPSVPSTTVTPGTAVAAPVAGQCDAAFPVKGNVTENRIYHLPGSTYYERTYAEFCFASTEAAQAAGFRAPN
jgi:hypothetical protein